MTPAEERRQEFLGEIQAVRARAESITERMSAACRIPNAENHLDVDQAAIEMAQAHFTIATLTLARALWGTK